MKEKKMRRLPACAYCNATDWSLSIEVDEALQPRVYQARCNICGGMAPPARDPYIAMFQAARRPGDSGPRFSRERTAQLVPVAGVWQPAVRIVPDAPSTVNGTEPAEGQ